MRVDQFDFDLPQARIALRPAEPRDSARMMVVDPRRSEPVIDSAFRQLPDWLEPGDVLVMNNTKVIPAELRGIRHRGENQSAVSLTLHKRVGDDAWLAFARPAKRLKPGDKLVFGSSGSPSGDGAFEASVAGRGDGGEVTISFDRSGPDLDAAIAAVGHIPLPPYIASKREEDDRDRRDYQTVYAKHKGAVAAPTAGLHFTERMLATVDERGIGRQVVTLHVGAGTFLPVKVDDTDEHRMHAEWGRISEETATALNSAKATGGRLVAVGTTALRLLESAATDDGVIQPFSAETDIFIQPGYRFKAVDVLLTNFHLPRSTLFMLVSAFCGRETMLTAYQEAIDRDYRFYSYGDASLLFRQAAA